MQSPSLGIEETFVGGKAYWQMRKTPGRMHPVPYMNESFVPRAVPHQVLPQNSQIPVPPAVATARKTRRQSPRRKEQLHQRNQLVGYPLARRIKPPNLHEVLISPRGTQHLLLPGKSPVPYLRKHPPQGPARNPFHRHLKIPARSGSITRYRILPFQTCPPTQLLLRQYPRS